MKRSDSRAKEMQTSSLPILTFESATGMLSSIGLTNLIDDRTRIEDSCKVVGGSSGAIYT